MANQKALEELCVRMVSSTNEARICYLKSMQAARAQEMGAAADLLARGDEQYAVCRWRRAARWIMSACSSCTRKISLSVPRRTKHLRSKQGISIKYSQTNDFSRASRYRYPPESGGLLLQKSKVLYLFEHIYVKR